MRGIPKNGGIYPTNPIGYDQPLGCEMGGNPFAPQGECATPPSSNGSSCGHPFGEKCGETPKRVVGFLKHPKHDMGGNW